MNKNLTKASLGSEKNIGNFLCFLIAKKDQFGYLIVKNDFNP